MVNVLPTHTKNCTLQMDITKLMKGTQPMEAGNTAAPVKIQTKRQYYLQPSYSISAIELIMIFCLGGIAGTIIETFWIGVSQHQLQWRSPLIFCPIHPIYAIGTFLMTIFLRPLLKFKAKYLSVFVGAAVIGSAFEFCASLAQSLVFHSTSWEYHSQKFNIAGRTSLGMAICWGFLGLGWVVFALPWLLEFINWMKPQVMHKIAIYCALLFIASAILSTTAVFEWELRMKGKPHHTAYAEFVDYLLPDRVMKIFYPTLKFSFSS